MATVIVAAGSNLGNRLHYLQKAGTFLSEISEKAVIKSSVWESEPVGPAKFRFLNSVAVIETNLVPEILLQKLKKFEHILGREEYPDRWGPRILDLDIIAYNSLVIQTDSLIIPHPEYHNRLFVLLPMDEVFPEWKDPDTGKVMTEMIEDAPKIEIHKTEYSW